MIELGDKVVTYGLFLTLCEWVQEYNVCVIPRAKQRILRIIKDICANHGLSYIIVLKECK